MRNIYKKLIYHIVSVLLVISILFTFPMTASAKSYITSSGSAKGSNYTSIAALASKLDSIFVGSIGLYSNSACTKSVSVSLGSRKMTGSNKYYVKSNTSGNTIAGWQCYIYAEAVYNTLFNEWVGRGTSLSHSKKVMSGGLSSVSYNSLKDAGVKTGAIMRTTANSDGSWNSSKAHSLIILSYNSSSITYLEGNGDGKGLVRIANLSWKEFNAGQLSGRSRYVCHIVQPTDSYYDKLYPSADETPKITLNKSSLSLGLYSNNSITVTATINGAWTNVVNSTSSKYNVVCSSQNGNKLTYKITAKSAGSDVFTLTSYNNGKVMASSSIDVKIAGSTLSSTANSVSLDLTGVNSTTFNLSAGGNLPSRISISSSYPNDVCSVSYGSWNGTSIPVTVTGKSVGSGTITFYLKNADNSTIIATKNVSFNVNASSYAVTYNANGGSNAPPKQTKKHGQSIRLSTVVPIGKTYTIKFNGNGGYVSKSSEVYNQLFSGWNTKADGTGTAYSSGEIYSANSDVTLYAQWSNPSFSDIKATRDNYYFLGWYDSDEINEYGKPIGNKYSYATPITKDVTLYAMWSTDLDLTIFFGDYNLDGKIDFITDIAAMNNISLGRLKYTDEDIFRCDVNADGVVNADDVTLLNDVRLGKFNMYSMPAYLYYKNITVKQKPTKTIYRYGEDFDATGLVLQANYTNGLMHDISSGYVVTGYNPNKIGVQSVNVDYYIGSTSFNVEVKAPEYSLYYDANGGYIASSGKIVEYSRSVGELPIPTREGYTFLGWSYDLNGTDYLSASDIYNNMSNKTIYAQWRINKYSVTYVANGGTNLPLFVNSIDYMSEFTVDASVIPIRNGYTFLGYSTDEKALIPMYIPGDTITITDNITLYVVWKQAEELNGDSVVNSNIDFPNQIQVFKFVPNANGMYRFYCSENISLNGTFVDGNEVISEFNNESDFEITVNLIKDKIYYFYISSEKIGEFSLYNDWLPSEYEISLYNPLTAQTEYLLASELDNIIELPILENENHTFIGWKKSDDETIISTLDNICTDVDLIAVWSEKILLGDVNGDGIVDAADAGLISRYDAGLINLTAEQLQAGDVNKDGEVDAGDAGIISRYDAGLITKLN